MCKNWLAEALTISEAGVVNYDAELNSKELSSTELNSTELKTLALACKNLVSENINNHTQGSATTACPSLYFSGKGQHQARLPITGLLITGFIAIGLMLCLLLAGLWATPAEAHGSHTTSHLNNSCYVGDNIGKVGTEPPCLNMLIVCQYDDAAQLRPNRPTSCPTVDSRKYSIHWPSQESQDWTWSYDADKNDYYKEKDGVNYYFGQHSGERQIFTGQVTSMRYIFYRDYKFNADIGNWDTSHVINMSYMFSQAFAFNQDIGGWDTSQLNWADSMFEEAIAFNQDIGGWDTSHVITMPYMFSQASAFNQDLSHWNLSGLAGGSDGSGTYAFQDIFYTPIAYGNEGYDSALSVDNYDAFLTSFKQSGIDLSYYLFSGGSSRFCEAASTTNSDPFFHVTYNNKTTYDCYPRITRVTLVPAGSTDSQVSTLKLIVTFSEPVFSVGGGALETNDFKVEIRDSECSCGATMTQNLASSISQIGNSYTLDVDITGTLQADQVIKVSPVYESIFDVDGNAASHISN
jgi:surface protein